MPRLAPLDLNKLTPEQKKVADAIVAGPRGGLRGPFEPWLRRPELADRAQKLGEYCRFNNSLPRDLSRAGDLPGRPALQGAVRVLRPCPPRQGSRALAPRSSKRCAPRQTPPFTRDVERIVYDFVTEYLDDQPRLGAQLQARDRRLRRAGRGRSGGRVRLLHAGVDDAQRLRDAAAAGRARAARLRPARDLPPLPGGRLRSSRCRRDPASSTSPPAPWPAAAARPGLEPGNGDRRPGPCRGRRGRRIGAGHGERRGLRLLKIVGALYLVWLGIKTVREAAHRCLRRRCAGVGSTAGPFATASWSRRSTPRRPPSSWPSCRSSSIPRRTGLAAVPRARPHLGDAEHDGRHHRRAHRLPRPLDGPRTAVAAAPAAHGAGAVLAGLGLSLLLARRPASL